jgi:PPM family protein phosphatase
MDRTDDRAAELGPGEEPSDDVRRRIESYGLSHTGRVRPANEDHFVIASLQRSLELRQTNLDDRALFDRLRGPKAYLYAVADGVGGQAGGRLASGMAVETIVEYLSETVGSYHAVPPGEEQEFLEPLRRGVQRAHEKLLATFREQDRGGPATTLTIALLVWPRAFVVHVGDSRAYHWRAGEIRRLTRDQTLGAYMLEQRAMSEQQVERAGYHNVLTSAVGSDDMTPAVDVLDMVPGDRLLLCTDGLTMHVADERIAEMIGRGADPESSCRELVQRALDEGGKDNVTAIVVHALES